MATAARRLEVIGVQSLAALIQRDDVIDLSDRIAVALLAYFAQWMLRNISAPQSTPCAIIAAIMRRAARRPYWCRVVGVPPMLLAMRLTRETVATRIRTDVFGSNWHQSKRL